MERVTEAASRRQRVIQTVLLFIILATLPFYCLGGVLFAGLPSRSGRVTQAITTFTPVIGDATNTPYPSITPFATLVAPITTATPFGSNPLLPTPTQLLLATVVPPTYIAFATNTPRPFPTSTSIIIIPPTSTSIPFSTPILLPPTATPISAPPTPLRPTLTPIRIGSPVIILPPTFTPTKTSGQANGVTPSPRAK